MSESFYGIEIWDSTNPNNPYYTEIYVKQEIDYVFHSSVNEPINSKKPIVIYPSNTNYFTGSCTGNFADSKRDEDCCIDFEDVAFKIGFIKWLGNTKTKMLKLADDLVLEVSICC